MGADLPTDQTPMENHVRQNRVFKQWGDNRWRSHLVSAGKGEGHRYMQDTVKHVR